MVCENETLINNLPPFFLPSVDLDGFALSLWFFRLGFKHFRSVSHVLVDPCVLLFQETPLKSMVLMVREILHVRLVVAADLLDADVILGLDVGLSGGVCTGQSHHAGDVLKVLLVFNFDLWERRHT